MPLLDHFHPPVSEEIQWNSFHAAFAGSITDQLTAAVPAGYRVQEHFKIGGGFEIDVATVRTPAAGAEWRSAWQPAPRAAAFDSVFPDRFEVLVFRQSGGKQLVGAIELVSPGNKDEEKTRRAFATKVAGYLHEGVSVVVLDVVTERKANLHNEVVALLGAPGDVRLPAKPELYAVSYRPVLREGRPPQVEVWTEAFSVGDPLPTMPLRLVADFFVPVDFEAAYTDARRRRQLL